MSPAQLVRNTFNGSSRDARIRRHQAREQRHDGQRARDAASVSGSDALTPNTSFSRIFPDAERGDRPAAMPIERRRHPFEHDQPHDVAVRAPSAVLIPISRLRPRTMYDSTL